LPALFNLGTDLSLLGHYTEAINILEKALAKRPENDSLLCNLGAAYEGVGRPIDAFRCWNEALKLNPENTYAKANLGSARPVET